MVEELSQGLDWLDNAHTAQTPKALVQFLEEVARTLYTDARLLVSPSSEYNYSIVDLVPPYASLARGSLSSPAATALIKGLPKALYLVRFPRIERDNVLNHAIFGHEFGHPIADEFIAQHEQQAVFARRLGDAKARIQADSQLNGSLLAITDVLERNRLLSRYVDTVAEMHKRALQELVSDAVGVHLFGPGAVLAALDIFGQGSLDETPNYPYYYPPSRFRIRLMSKLLASAGHVAALRRLVFGTGVAAVRKSTHSVLDHLESIVSQDFDTAEISRHPLARIAYEWLTETLPDALGYALGRVAGLVYSASVVNTQVPALVERLSLNVPPNEMGIWPNTSTADWRSGLLASWLMVLTQMSDSALSPDERLKAVRTTHKLALKGIEYSLLQEHYKAFMVQGGPP